MGTFDWYSFGYACITKVSPSVNGIMTGFIAGKHDVLLFLLKTR